MRATGAYSCSFGNSVRLEEGGAGVYDFSRCTWADDLLLENRTGHHAVILLNRDRGRPTVSSHESGSSHTIILVEVPGAGSLFSIERKLDVLITDVGRSPDAGQSVTLGVAKLSGANTWGYGSSHGTISTTTITEFDSSGDTLRNLDYREHSDEVPEVRLAFNASGFAGFSTYKGQMIISTLERESIFLFGEATQTSHGSGSNAERRFTWRAELVIGDHPRWIEEEAGNDVIVRFLREGAARTEALLVDIESTANTIEDTVEDIDDRAVLNDVVLRNIQADLGRYAEHDGERRSVTSGSNSANNIHGYNEGSFGSMADRSVTVEGQALQYNQVQYAEISGFLIITVSDSFDIENILGHRWELRRSGDRTVVYAHEALVSGNSLIWDTSRQHDEAASWLDGQGAFTLDSLPSLSAQVYRGGEILTDIEGLEVDVGALEADVANLHAETNRSFLEMQSDLGRSPRYAGESRVVTVGVLNDVTFGYSEPAPLGSMTDRSVTLRDSDATYDMVLWSSVEDRFYLGFTGTVTLEDVQGHRWVLRSGSNETLLFGDEAVIQSASDSTLRFDSGIRHGDDISWMEALEDDDTFTIHSLASRAGAVYRGDDIVTDIAGVESSIDGLSDEIDDVDTALLELRSDIGRDPRLDGIRRTVTVGVSSTGLGKGYQVSDSDSYGSIDDAGLELLDGGRNYEIVQYVDGANQVEIGFTAGFNVDDDLRGHRWVLRSGTNRTVVFAEDADKTMERLDWDDGAWHGDDPAWIFALSAGDTFTIDSLYSLAPAVYRGDELVEEVTGLRAVADATFDNTRLTRTDIGRTPWADGTEVVLTKGANGGSTNFGYREAGADSYGDSDDTEITVGEVSRQLTATFYSNADDELTFHFNASIVPATLRGYLFYLTGPDGELSWAFPEDATRTNGNNATLVWAVEDVYGDAISWIESLSDSANFSLWAVQNRHSHLYSTEVNLDTVEAGIADLLDRHDGGADYVRRAVNGNIQAATPATAQYVIMWSRDATSFLWTEANLSANAEKIIAIRDADLVTAVSGSDSHQKERLITVGTLAGEVTLPTG